MKFPSSRRRAESLLCRPGGGRFPFVICKGIWWARRPGVFVGGGDERAPTKSIRRARVFDLVLRQIILANSIEKKKKSYHAKATNDHTLHSTAFARIAPHRTASDRIASERIDSHRIVNCSDNSPKASSRFLSSLGFGTVPSIVSFDLFEDPT